MVRIQVSQSVEELLQGLNFWFWNHASYPRVRYPRCLDRFGCSTGSNSGKWRYFYRRIYTSKMISPWMVSEFLMDKYGFCKGTSIPQNLNSWICCKWGRKKISEWRKASDCRFLCTKYGADVENVGMFGRFSPGYSFVDEILDQVVRAYRTLRNTVRFQWVLWL